MGSCCGCGVTTRIAANACTAAADNVSPVMSEVTTGSEVYSPNVNFYRNWSGSTGEPVTIGDIQRFDARMEHVLRQS